MERSAATTGKTPKALLDRPVIDWCYISLVHDFHRLNKSRTSGMSGANPLDLPSIIAYNEAVSKEPMEFFIDVMQELDQVFLTAQRKKSERKEAAKKRN